MTVPLPDLLVVAGVVLALIGLAMLSVAVALVVLGVIVAGVGLLLHWHAPRGEGEQMPAAKNEPEDS